MKLIKSCRFHAFSYVEFFDILRCLWYTNTRLLQLFLHKNLLYIEVISLDKYEYGLKMDQLKALCLEGKYEEAAEIADSINWNKVKNVNALVKVGEIYEKVGRFEESREPYS